MCATSSYLKMSGSTVKILLLQEDTYLLFRSRKYGSRVTKPYLLAHYVADLVLQLRQQRQFLIQFTFCVLELMASYKSPAGCWMSSSHAELLSQTQISPRRMGHPQPIDASAPVCLHFILHTFFTAFLPSSLTGHHLSAAKTHCKFANFTAFHSLLGAFGLKMALPFT